MAQQTLSAKKIAIMVSAGFDEAQFIDLQKAMMTNNAWLKVVSNKPGLVNGARDGKLGMAYPVDSVLAETLAIDYDALIIPGGVKHVEALMEEPHALRILRAFLREDMAVLFIDDAIDMLGQVESAVSLSDFDLTADVELKSSIVKAKSKAPIASILAELAMAMSVADEEQAA